MEYDGKDKTNNHQLVKYSWISRKFCFHLIRLEFSGILLIPVNMKKYGISEG